MVMDFSPQSDHEQRGTRPGFVASNNAYHELTNLAIVCPITSTDRGFPLHIRLDSRTNTRGVIMCEQAKSLDLAARGAKLVERCPQDITDEVVDVLIGSVEVLRT